MLLQSSTSSPPGHLGRGTAGGFPRCFLHCPTWCLGPDFVLLKPLDGPVQGQLLAARDLFPPLASAFV